MFNNFKDYSCQYCKYYKHKTCYHESNMIYNGINGKQIPKFSAVILNYECQCKNHKFKEKFWYRIKEFINDHTSFFRRLKNEIVNGHDKYNRVMNNLSIVEPEELFSLDYTICIFLIPRLKELKKILEKHIDFEDDPKYLIKMQNVIDTFEEMKKEIDGQTYCDANFNIKEHDKRKKQAFKDFEEIFYGLWW